jgi:diguanylate cyclase (GGDEF)-like protein
MTAQQLSRTAEELQPEFARNPMQRFAMAFGLYVLWTGLVWLGVRLGRIDLPAGAATLLLCGVAATNALFGVLARAASRHQPPPGPMVAVQCLMGLAWVTAFTALRSGGAEFSLGMYVTAVLYALFQVGQLTFIRLMLMAALGYAAAVLGRLQWLPGEPVFGAEVLNLVVFLGVASWLLVFAHHLHALRSQLHDRNAELQEMVLKVSRVAERDHLTKSFNRHYIMETLAREKGRADRSNNPVSIVILDLDHFKAINDDHGHLVGDRILRGVAKRVRAELRSMDAINRSDYRRSLGRFGGEEFIVILPGTGLRGAAHCAERIRAAIASRPFDESYRVTISVGVAEYRRGETVPELLTRADEALYRAKSEGRNRVIVNGDLSMMRAEVLDLRPATR